MKQTLTKPPKILLLFVGGIGLPSLLLGYLAFRGVKNDQALIEKDRIEEHRLFATQIVRAMDEGLSHVERSFRDALAGVDTEDLDTLVPKLQAFKERYPLIEDIFALRGSNETFFPCAPLLYQSAVNPAIPFGSSMIPALSRSLEEGEKQEFRDHNLAQALRFYRQALRESGNRQEKGEVLSRIARVQKKSGRLEQAVDTYRLIADDCDRIRTGAGLPLGLVARLETGILFLQLKNPSRSMETMLGLYDELLKGRWLLDKEEFDFAVKRTKDGISGILSQELSPDDSTASEDAYQALEGKEGKERIRTERYLLFQKEAPQAIEWRTPVAQNSSPGGTKRLSLEVGREKYLLSLVPQDEQRAADNETWGLILEADTLLNTLVLEPLDSSLPEAKVRWVLKDRAGNVLATSTPPPAGTLTITAGFEENFPDWTLEFYHQDVPLFEALLTSRRGVYFIMFFLIAGILIFGFILSIRTITREVELARMKSDFVSTVSHEFKSPLTSIRQIAEMLESGRVPSESRRQRYYEVLLEQSERLSLITDNVLNFAKMEAGKKEFHFETVDIGILLEELVPSIQERVRHEGFEIETDIEEPLPSVSADVSALSQAITNLIDNAVKYSGGSKNISVRAYGDDLHLVVAVKDYGVGIRKEEMDKIFERFYRGGDELTRTVKGSGLGLTLVKQVVGAHKGTVRVESEPGKGSVFSIRLPSDQSKG